MKKEELIKAYAYAELLWSTFKKETNNEKAQMQNQLWWEFLKKYPFDVICASMRELAKESDFCNIAKISQGCLEITRLLGENQSENDIFNEIDKAVSNGAYCSKESFDNLSPIAQRVVGSASNLASWGQVDIQQYNTVIASNIRRAVRNELDREDKKQRIGVDTLKLIKSENKLLLDN